jgi:hypothetical protein
MPLIPILFARGRAFRSGLTRSDTQSYAHMKPESTVMFGEAERAKNGKGAKEETCSAR